MLPTKDEHRKQYPIWTFIFDYFPDSISELARHSYLSDSKHTPEGHEDGSPMKWDKGASIGDGNQSLRHLVDGFTAYNKMDQSLEKYYLLAKYHFGSHAWRALELHQRFLKGMKPFDKKISGFPYDSSDPLDSALYGKGS